MTNQSKSDEITLYSHIQTNQIEKLITKFGLKVKKIETGDIPGSYWGDSEAGLIKNNLYIRGDTPVHSLLHETCHYICMDKVRRDKLDTNAGGNYDEENAVCYLQILLSDYLEKYDRSKMFDEMDSWGYSFRLGSAQAWFESDSQDAKNWLMKKNIINQNEQVNWKLDQ